MSCRDAFVIAGVLCIFVDTITRLQQWDCLPVRQTTIVY